jgi:hypothetical protein
MQNLQYVSAIHLGIQCLEERNAPSDLGAVQHLKNLANEIIPGSGDRDVGKEKSHYHLPSGLLDGGKRKHKKKKRKTRKAKHRRKKKTRRRKRRGGGGSCLLH